MSESSQPGASIASDVRRGLVWSLASNLVLRMASLVLGIVLARLLLPAAFGAFAIGLAVQAVLLTLADLGLSAYLVRCEEPERSAPTVATLSLSSGILLSLMMSASSGIVARALNEPRASGVIAVLSFSLIISGAGIVPYARLQRDFQQRKLFACTALDFLAYTTVTISLVLIGLGPVALALGRVTGQLLDTSLQFVLARVKPRFGYDGGVMRATMAYGAPLALANLLSWALLNIDNIVVARVAGATQLGLYVLAFNISNWPMNAIGQAVRAVALPGFARTARGDGQRPLVTALGLTWTAALLVGVLLGALSHPLVAFLYGPRWHASAAVLSALATFGALRVVFDLIASFLMATGAARPVLYVQMLWFLALIPPMVAATQAFGIRGAGWSHVAVAVLVILPIYGLALRHVGTKPRSLLAAMWLPTLAALPTWWLAHTVALEIRQPILALLLGGAAGTALYVSITGWWVWRLLLSLRAAPDQPMTGRIEQPALSTVG